MLTAIKDAVDQLLPARRRYNSTSGWTSFNAVCCQHRGESQDTRGRGGVIVNANGAISYSCFNCNYTANYTPGRHLNYKFRKLLTWLGADDNTVKRLVIEAIRVRDLVAPEQVEETKADVVFSARALPEQAQTLHALHVFYELSNNNTSVPKEFHDAVIYSANRELDLVKYTCYWTPEQAYNLHKRLIIPFTWRNEVIGYTARAIYDDVRPKYYSQYDANYVYNVDRQPADAQFVVVVEGAFDAMAIDGVAVLSNECNETQADIIDALAREVIVVPDRDRAGIKLIDAALEYGWSVSFPIWQETCKDVSEAVQHYGRLFVLKSILDARESNRLKIELKKKRLNNV